MNIISRLFSRLLSWHLTPSNAKNYDFIDGLRGLAILLVVTCHLLYINPNSSGFVKFVFGLFGAGTCGVTLFFCLSGYLVSLPFWKLKLRNSTNVVPKGYTQRRFFKIYPPLALSIVWFTPIYIHNNHDYSLLLTASQWLTGLSLFFPVDGRLNPVMWSLIVEVQFYLLLPFVMFLFYKVSMRKSVWLVPLLFAFIGFSSRHLWAAYGVQASISPHLYVPLFSNLDVFAMGVLVAGLYTAGFIKRNWAVLGNIAFLMLLVIFPIISLLCVTHRLDWVEGETMNLYMKLTFGFMLFFVSDTKRFCALLLCNPLLRWFGIISYEWYLFHQFIYYWFRHTYGPANGDRFTYLLIVGGSFTTSLLLAAMVYRYISLPILTYGRSLHQIVIKARPSNQIDGSLASGSETPHQH